jgi:hypothetical protein
MRAADILLRIAVAFAFLYPPVNAWGDPYAWIGYFPTFVRDLGRELAILHVFGAVEIVLGLWIISGWRIFYPSLAAATTLALIVACNLGDFQVLFRDISIALAALALAAMHRRNRISA